MFIDLVYLRSLVCIDVLLILLIWVYNSNLVLVWFQLLELCGEIVVCEVNIDVIIPMVHIKLTARMFVVVFNVLLCL